MTTILEESFESSSHPYEDNLDDYTTISMPGAVTFTITFDPASRTEHNCDFVEFFVDETHGELVAGSQRYSGRDGMTIPTHLLTTHLLFLTNPPTLFLITRFPYPNNPFNHSGSENFPGTGDREPLVIEGSSCVLHFHSDSSTNDWGYKFTAKGVCEQRTNPPMRPTLPHLTMLRHLKVLGLQALKNCLESTLTRASPVSTVTRASADRRTEGWLAPLHAPLPLAYNKVNRLGLSVIIYTLWHYTQPLQ